MARLRLVCVALAVAAAACARALPTSATGEQGAGRLSRGQGSEALARAQVDMQAERLGLLAADSALSVASARDGFLAGVAPRFAGDVAYLQPGQRLMVGRDSVRAFLARTPAAAELRFAWRAIRTDVSSDGLLGYTFGYGRMTAPGGTAPAPGGYAIVWRKGSDGQWLVKAFLRNNSNANLAAAPAGFESPTYRHYRAFPGTSEEEARNAVRQADIAFSNHSRENGIADAFATYAAPDGALLLGAFGPDAIRAAQANVPRSVVGTWTPVVAEATPTADFGYTVGAATFVRTENGSVTTNHSKYITVWKRQRTGEWLYVFDAGNGSPAR